MPLVELRDSFTRLNYFNGFFLQKTDFEVQADYHVDVARYLHFLLFDEGRLYDNDTVTPLDVTAAGHVVTVDPGRAMIRAPLQGRAYEVHLETAIAFNLDDPALTRGDGTALQDGDALILTIEPAQRLTRTAASVSLVPDPDRIVEQARVVLHAPGDALPTGPHLMLANLVHRTAGAVDTEVTPTSVRGGVRLEILSGSVRAALAGSSGGPALLNSITLSPPGASLNVGDSHVISALGNFSDSTSRPLTVGGGGDGLLWSSSNAAVASVTNTDATTVTAVAPGTTTVTASVAAVTANATVTVVAAATPLISLVLPITGSPPGMLVRARGTNLHDGISKPAVALSALGHTEVVSAANVFLRPDLGGGVQEIGFLMPVVPSGSGWAASGQAVQLEVTFGGPPPGTFAYKYA